ncbi:MAG: hypothetical protein AAF702_25405 [Chloroflexota bacterium]
MSTTTPNSFDAGKEKLRQLLMADTPPRNECDGYQPLLHDYVEAQLAGADYLGAFEEIALHLDNCLTCADVYARLYDLELALGTDSLPVPVSLLTPDLGFLQISAEGRKPTLAELLSETITRMADTIRVQLTEELLVLLQPPQDMLQSAALVRAADNARFQELLYEIQPEQLPPTAVPMRLAVYQDAEAETMCLVEITITPPGEAWPALGGRTVHVQVGDEQHSATTDAWGVAAFEEIPVARLSSLEVTFGI